MDTEKTKTRKAFIINIFYFVIILMLIHFGIKYLLSWIMPFVIGFAIAYILKPLINVVSKKITRIPKKVIASITVIIFYLLIISIISLLGWQLADFLAGWVQKLPNTYSTYIAPTIEKFSTTINEIVNKFMPEIGEDLIKQSSDWMIYLQTAVEKLAGGIASGAGSLGKRMPNFLSTLVFAILSSVFITIDYQNVVKGLLSLFSKNVNKKIFKFKTYLTETAFKYVKALLILMGITFVELVIGLAILRVENVFMVAAITAVTDALPVLGVGTILLPWALVELIKGNFAKALGFLILYIVIAVIRQVIEPRVMANQLGIHPVLTLLCVYLGFKWMGFLGVVILLFSTIIFVNFLKSGENPFMVEKDLKTAEEKTEI